MGKKKQKLYKSNQVSDTNYMKIVWITLGVLIVLGLVYFFTALGTGEIKLGKKEKETKEETKIEYQEIIGGEVFNRSNEDYYVLFYESDDTFGSYYKSLITNYSYKDSSLPFYTVDLSKKINSEYKIDSEGTIEYATPKDISTLKVGNPSIIRIRNKQVLEYVGGRDSVIEFFNK